MSLFSGINDGIRTGSSLALSALNQADREKRLDAQDAERIEEKQYRRGLDASNQARQARQDERQAGSDQLAVAGQLDAEIRNEARGAAATGGFGSAEDAARYGDKKAQADRLRAEGRKKLTGYEAEAEKAPQTFAALQSGKVDIAQVPGADLGAAVSYTFGHPFEDFIDTPEAPSKIGQAFSDFGAALANRDFNALLGPANTLLRPEIEHGVGTKLKNGDVIVDKQISRIDPHPTSKGHVLVGLSVKAQKPDGTVYDYAAPVTKGRVANGDDDEVLPVDINAVMQRIGSYGDVLAALNDPAAAPVIQQKAQEWRQAGGTEQWQALRRDFIARGGDPKDFDGGKTTRDKLDLGDRVVEREYDESGNQIKSTEHRKGAAPKAPREDDPAGDDLKRAQADYYRGRASGGLAGAGGRSGGGGKEYLVNPATGDEQPYNGGDIPDGYQVIKAGTKAQNLGPKDRRKEAESILGELQKNYREEVKAGGLRGAQQKAPTIEDAIAELDRRDKAFAPKPPPPPPIPPLQDTRAANPPLRAAGIQEGATAVNRQTGERVQFRNGKWEPVQ